MRRLSTSAVGLALAATVAGAATASAQDEPPVYLRDRGTGVALSIFGTYVRPGELLIYPFYEYYRDNDLEYEPFELGFGSTLAFRGRYRAHEVLIFLGYGITERLALEFEAGIITATLEKSPDDLSALPAILEESGLSDVEAQLRWRWIRESDSRPEVFNYFETVFPLSERNGLIGTSDWEFKLGTGVVKGFRWGTMAVRAAVDYAAAEDKFEIGEYAVEYLKRVSRGLRLFAMVEGSEDEIELVPEIQLHLGRRAYVKLNAGLALTSKATDFAPETGIVFVIPTR